MNMTKTIPAFVFENKNYQKKLKGIFCSNFEA